MKKSGRGRRRARLSFAVAITTAMLTAGLASPAQADPVATPAGDQAAINAYVKKYDHPMGSQIQKHEPVAQMPGSVDPADSGVLASVEGIDVSGHQGNVDWAAQWNAGRRFVWAKATEGTGYKNPYFAQQYNGSYNVGMVRGAYHFALPNSSSGATQANYFATNGGGWSRDGKTLPGALDIEWNPYGAACYGKTQSAMVTWIRDFLNQYRARTGRDAVIYTATSWWTECTGNYAGFASANPLWIARYASAVGTLPAGWSYYTMWQYTSSGPTVGDHDKFNGALDRVVALANG
jgi:GH25 family lysozyme M1 (1,4-beta-N-acetylmuramidase)